MSFLLAAAAGTLVPVEIGSSELEEEGTFISEIARNSVEEKTVVTLRCLTIPEKRNGTDRVCLTSAEWQKVLDRVAFNEGADRRDRAILMAHYNANRPSSRPD